MILDRENTARNNSVSGWSALDATGDSKEERLTDTYGPCSGHSLNQTLEIPVFCRPLSGPVEWGLLRSSVNIREVLISVVFQAGII